MGASDHDSGVIATLEAPRHQKLAARDLTGYKSGSQLKTGIAQIGAGLPPGRRRYKNIKGRY
jgi:hypothetical protein